MKKYFALAALLLVTACASNDNTTRQQMVPTALPAPNLTQASSIATPGAGKTSFSANQLPPVRATASSHFVQQVLQLVNDHRAAAGVSPLGTDETLSDMAMVKAQDMFYRNYFDHTSPTYGSPFEMMKRYGIVYRNAGENIAKGQTSPEQVMNDWMNSEGHRVNILDRSFTTIGIAYYNGVWVQEFIG